MGHIILTDFPGAGYVEFDGTSDDAYWIIHRLQEQVFCLFKGLELWKFPTVFEQW